MASTESLDDAVTPRRLTLVFQGTASDYFRVWIVNLCLTLVTLGGYSAWAKVRRKEYLYSQTSLDGTPFRYVAPPLAIFKGRVLAALLVTLYVASTEVLLDLRPYAWLIGALALPWILVRATQFDAHYSRFRNIPFEFGGDYAGAFRACAGAALLAATGLGLPWAYCRVMSYFARHSSYAGVSASLTCRGERLFFSFLLALLLAVASAAVAIVLLVWVFSERHARPDWLVPACVLAMYGGYAAGYALFHARATNLLWQSARLGPLTFLSRLRARELFVIYVTNTLAIMASLGLLVPWATVRLARYRVQRLTVLADSEWDEFSRASKDGVAATGSAVAESLVDSLPVGS